MPLSNDGSRIFPKDYKRQLTFLKRFTASLLWRWILRSPAHASLGKRIFSKLMPQKRSSLPKIDTVGLQICKIPRSLSSEPEQNPAILSINRERISNFCSKWFRMILLVSRGQELRQKADSGFLSGFSGILVSFAGNTIDYWDGRLI